MVLSTYQHGPSWVMQCGVIAKDTSTPSFVAISPSLSPYAHSLLHIHLLTCALPQGLPEAFCPIWVLRLSQSLGTLWGCVAQAPVSTFQPFHHTELSPLSPVWISVAWGSNMLCQHCRTNNTSSTRGSSTACSPNFKSTSNGQCLFLLLLLPTASSGEDHCHQLMPRGGMTSHHTTYF